ncbi:MAG: hypothetical protein JRI56_09790 [Deltaproteobacteria bacterium]|nr:hypothetical protein [Deltaproteobacteria bacterium]
MQILRRFSIAITSCMEVKREKEKDRQAGDEILPFLPFVHLIRLRSG